MFDPEMELIKSRAYHDVYDSLQTPTAHSDTDQRAIGTSWPTLADDALYGLAGDIVRVIEPHSEADPVAILATVIAMFGNCVGAGPFVRVEHTKHFFRFFVTLVGETSKARKGQSLSTPRYMFEQVDLDWASQRISSGLSSGEGLIQQVRDPRYAMRDGEEILVDKGEPDKRFLLIEEELAGPLKIAQREGSTLSAILRQAWDKGTLQPLTKTNPIRATGAHISILGHITADELRRHLTETEQGNGFANRFLWLLVKRSKLLPRPKGVSSNELDPLIEKLKKAIESARDTTEIDFDDDAGTNWDNCYGQLSEGKPGLFGAVVGRAEAQVFRLAGLQASLNSSSAITVPHLKAALALWDYSEESAKIIFSDAVGDPTADTILHALQQNPDGLTRTDISAVLGRNNKATEIDRGLSSLLSGGMARREKESTGGRPSERWYSSTNLTKETK